MGEGGGPRAGVKQVPRAGATDTEGWRGQAGHTHHLQMLGLPGLSRGQENGEHRTQGKQGTHDNFLFAGKSRH